MPTNDFDTLLDLALKGEGIALCSLAKYLLAKDCSQQEIVKAIPVIDELCSSNIPQNSFAMILRAHMHRFEIGGPKNVKEAIRLYEKAKNLGDNYSKIEYDKLVKKQHIFNEDLDKARVC